MAPDWLPWLLQVNDSAFPSGAYAHSLGLEELVQAGMVPDPDALEVFLHQQVLPGLMAQEIPWLAAAHRCAAAGDPGGLAALDREWSAWKPAAETRAASQSLGSRRLALICQLDPDPLLRQYAAGSPPCHHLIVVALELRHLPVEAAACAYAHQSLAGYATAAMKLMRLGQDRCQAILRRVLLAAFPELSHATRVPLEEAGWFNPLQEIASMRHATATERLFIS